MEWIKCSEKHPSIEEKVLVLIPVCGRFNIESAEYIGEGQFLCAWFSTRGDGCAYKVTHWMPRPPPPSE